MLLKGWKTILFNVGALLPALWDLMGMFTSDVSPAPVVPEQYRPLYTVGIIVINLWLRLHTTGPVGVGNPRR